ncbi:MAG: hypothetical protein IJX74_05675 [Clostridia bacterium]|nr:hypothetical protein [Clostridia bacterium]
MELDRTQLQRLLALDDEKFKKVLLGIAREYGIDTSAINVGKEDIARLRLILSTASENDIQNLINGFKNGGGRA